MALEDETYQRKVEKGFQEVLNRHGYGFQHRVLKLASSLFDQRKSAWVFEAAEFPVQVQGYGTRIDFILRLGRGWNSPFYMLAECKRANPSLSNWCFARVPFVRRNRSTYEHLFLEHAQRDEQDTVYAFAESWNVSAQNTYHIALEVRSDQKGDPSGKGRGAIEDAATQVCRGLNGMIEFLSGNVQILGDATGAYFLPVIFTTAQLWASDVDLGSAEIESGNIDLSGTGFSKKQWVFYQYHLSPGLKHSSSPADRPQTIGALMESEYIRTVAIVAAQGIEAFLEWSSDVVARLTGGSS